VYGTFDISSQCCCTHALFIHTHTRLPLGLSNETGLFSLQRASNAKHWKRPMSEPGKLLFDGIKVVISLEKAEFEKKW
jgi:hypothetical protein